MARIYLTGSGPSRGYATGSGIISNPVRILLQEKDSKTGSYPTIARTGDPDFSGQYASTFDDSKTINFVGGNLVYPTSLPASSIWVSGGVATPNILQGLIAVGTSSKGVADSQVEFTPGENIRPFDESRIYIDNDAAFYQTGTDLSILPGFDQKLASKTIISLDINPTEATNLTFSTGTLPNASGLEQGVNSGIAYFNWVEKKWDIIGDLSSGSNVDYARGYPWMTGSMLSVIASAFAQTTVDGVDLNDTMDLYGLPVSVAGFPLSTKFNPNSSQSLKLSSLLSSPVVVEKIACEISCTLGCFPLTPNTEGLSNITLMLLKHQDMPGSKRLITRKNFAAIDNTVPFPTSEFIDTFEADSFREIVWFGRTGQFISGSGYYSSLENLQQTSGSAYRACEKWVSLDGDAFPFQTNFTGCIEIQNECKIVGGTGISTPYIGNITSDGFLYFPYNEIGVSRDLFSLSSGRSFIKTIAGATLSGSSKTFSTFYKPNTTSQLQLQPVASSTFVSPYVLLPTDEIILVAVYQYSPIRSSFGNESIVQKNPTILSPGAGKLTLFGSLLRNNLPISPETNQPLTSDAIHEDLHYDNPVFDQFDVEPTSALTGSYVDLIITGSMLAIPIGSPIAAGVRKVQGSVAAGQAGTTGSLQRFVNLTSESDMFYDTIPPDIFGVNVALGGSGDALIQLGNAGAETKWLNAFPFEPSLSSVSRNLSQAATVYVLADPSDSGVTIGYTSTDKTNSHRYFLYGKNAFYRNAVGFSGNSTTTGGGLVRVWEKTEFRGAKYGLLNPTSLFSKSRFRRDHYGQYRDMLEQSPNAAFLVANSVEYPLEVKFFSEPDSSGKRTITQPLETHSQNLSPYATSSLPYFDGNAVDRTDDPDVTLDDLTIDV